MADRSLAGLLAHWLTVHLPTTRGCSANTIASYRDTFVLFLRHLKARHGTPPDQAGMADITPEAVEEFLGWLADARQASPATRNQRLI